jgi:N-acyl-D-aspartate/D-glutamate deacylase
MVIHHYVKEAWTRQTLADPDVIVVTDGAPMVSESVGVPPQGIGSYARVLGRYVREYEVLDLAAAIRKMTLLPAQRLETIAPAFSRKGRIQVGADADITVFDPETIIDNATYSDPFQASSGVRYLVVNGQLVVHAGEFQQNSLPGRRLSTLSP